MSSIFIIAEAGVNHNGNLDIAKKLVDMAIECGADAIKFQTFKAEECACEDTDKAEYQQINDAKEETQFEMLKRLELTYESFQILYDYCKIKGIVFMTTPFGEQSLGMCVDLDLSYIKISSTDITNHPFLKKVAQLKKPIILSTGMSFLKEVESALQVIYEAGNKEVHLMHCTTDYPVKVEEVNLRSIQTMREAFQVPVGFSDHTEGYEAAIGAVAMGASILEKHITLDNNMQGPDHKASANPKDFKKYVETIRRFEKMLGDGIKAPTSSEQEIMKVARRSIVLKRDVKKGDKVTEELLTYKRPAKGLSPEFANAIMGKVFIKDMKKDELILFENLME